MLRETSAASTIAASTATGALAACAWGTMNESATQRARVIRKPLRIKASFAPREGSIGRRDGLRKRLARSHFDLKSGARRFWPRRKRRRPAFSLCWKATREENQIKDGPKKTAASGASAAHWNGTLRL